MITIKSGSPVAIVCAAVPTASEDIGGRESMEGPGTFTAAESPGLSSPNVPFCKKKKIVGSNMSRR